MDATAQPPVEEFEMHRRLLFGVAYRMLSSAIDAEDIVQDAYLKWSQAHAIDNPAAWLTKVVTNLCLNRLTSARVGRESYPGPWLPEPVLTDDGTLTPSDAVDRRESASMGLLVLLERLSPAERAVFVLREAFGYPHREVADILDIEETYSRQLLRRARHHLGDSSRHLPADKTEHRRILEAFVAATRSGDVTGLATLLAEGVTAWSDGGGRTAARRPVLGRDRVLRYLVGIGARPESEGLDMRIAQVNGEPALLVWAGSRLRGVITVEAVNGRITTIRMMLNEDKLAFAASQATNTADRFAI